MSDQLKRATPPIPDGSPPQMTATPTSDGSPPQTATPPIPDGSPPQMTATPTPDGSPPQAATTPTPDGSPPQMTAPDVHRPARAAASPSAPRDRNVILEVRNLRKEYIVGEERVIALKRINLKIRRGEICCIFGSSGSGKSTLLNQLAGLERPTYGQVIIDGVSIPTLDEDALARFRQQHIGFIFQSYNLLPNLTAAENVALPLMFRGIDRAARERAAAGILHKVGLSNRADHYPSQMSGGQQQRTGIARAFVARPQLIFADEPTGNLDSKTTLEVMEMIVGFARRYHQTIILVSHDSLMAQYADRIITLLDGMVIDDTKPYPNPPANCENV